MDPKPILFIDFDGTLCHDKYWRSLPIEQHQNLQQLLFQDNIEMVREWMRGRYTAEEVNQFVSDSLAIPYGVLWEVFVRDCETMQVSKTTLEKIRFLSKTFTTLLITGNMDSFSRFTVPALKLDDYFNLISNSFFEGKHKTDDKGSLFTKYTDKFKAPIKDCVLIDDSEKCCDAFSHLGGVSHLITPERNLDHYLDELNA